MPKQGNTVESCTITEWKRKKGEQVKAGEVLFTYETDKATFGFESPADGTLLDIFFDAGADIPVLTNVAAIGNAGENCDALKPAGQAGATAPAQTPKPEMAQQVASTAGPSPAPAVITTASGDKGISPRARNLALDKGVDAAALAGSGPAGRVIERDVRAAAAARPFTPSAAAKLSSGGFAAPATGTGIGGRIRLADLVAAGSAPGGAAPGAGPSDEYTEVRFSKLRAIVAQRMSESLAQAAQLTMNTVADASRLLSLRAKIKANAEKMGIANINITDMVSYAVSRTLPRFPELNATTSGDSVRQFSHVHLALAVDTSRGLMVPVVRFADLLSLSDLALQLKSVASQAQDGSINPDLLAGGTITLSNMGTFGIESFTPIINRPQVAILGLNTIAPRAKEGPDGSIKLVPHIGLSLTIDHRAVDGAPAARFLQALVAAIENMELTLAM
jgi:pyruvate dehydrogenase E2 component (dihydrolipoamide acetyltransferase)